MRGHNPVAGPPLRVPTLTLKNTTFRMGHPGSQRQLRRTGVSALHVPGFAVLATCIRVWEMSPGSSGAEAWNIFTLAARLKSCPPEGLASRGWPAFAGFRPRWGLMPPASRLDLVLTPLIDWYGALFPTLVTAKESCDRRLYRSHLCRKT